MANYYETGSFDVCYNLAYEEYLLERGDADALMLWRRAPQLRLAGQRARAPERRRARVLFDRRECPLGPEPQLRHPEAGGESAPARSDSESGEILSALTLCGGDVELAAERLGVSRATLYRHVKRLGIGRKGPASLRLKSQKGLRLSHSILMP